jgi:hypothetical protein
MSIDEYTPLRGIIYTSSKLENCAFPGSIRANYDLRRGVGTEEDQLRVPIGHIAWADARKVGLVRP